MATRKVSGSDVVLILNLVLLCLFTDAKKIEDIVQESSGGLPFLQFTNGGVRVNFAGYHAEAGLGGLLGGTRTGGGLHASAGTPFGPQASAGLGGFLSGDNANTGGGLYAQAGLGNNRPSAKAGLGGVLDGSGRSNYPAVGGLFADADLGNNRPSAKAGLGGVLDGSGRSNYPAVGGLFADADLGNNQPAARAGLGGTLDENTNIPTSNNNIPSNPPPNHTNIQIISKSALKGHKNQRAIATKSIIINEDVPKSEYYGNLYAGANTGDVGGKSAVESVQKIPVVLPVNGLVSAKGVVETGANVDATVEPPIVNRWYLRKRLRAGPLSKQVIRTSSVIPVSAPIPAPALDTSSATASDTFSGKSFGKVISRINADVSSDSSKTYKSGSLFDDIFNIPISTLTAVNQLLRNNAG